MIEPLYILTTACTLMGIAAWQKPSFYVQFCQYKVPFTLWVIWTVFSIWSLAISVAKGQAIKAVPTDLEPPARMALSDNIEKAINGADIPTHWNVYLIIAFVFAILCGFVANALVKHEAKPKE
ncbi:hypothetical protein D3C81_76550 [compost metagenome]|uniref:hypothetical protein n=1 Tax=Serratia plymuthica TaxID=82996 RepID=UPI000560E68D|nr:hypothetical protein [Serratia plymuthica]ANJ94054.1 hypothetical protein ADP72_14125 [Serratia plymuthica]MBI6138085.1 hypothetical protein [Serratia plymuthica]NIC27059.1 hypothetical protein [Serratia plymuthica]